MATPVWCEIVCANCSKTAPGKYWHGVVRIREIKADAKRYGFIFTQDDCFCSDYCLKAWNND